MKKIISVLLSVISVPAIAAGTLTIQSLPSAPDAANPVCRDANGTLGNCTAPNGSASYSNDGVVTVNFDTLGDGAVICTVGPHTAGANEVALMTASLAFNVATAENGQIAHQYSTDGGANWSFCPTFYSPGSNPADGWGNITTNCRLELTPGESYLFAIKPASHASPSFVASGICFNLVQVVDDATPAPPPPTTSLEDEGQSLHPARAPRN